LLILLKEFWKSDFILNRLVGLVFEKNCIFLKAVESFIVDNPILSRFIKLTRLELSDGVNITWEGVEDVLEFLLFWWYFHNVLDLREFVLELKYFKELPTTAE
jgi:hypothetical protein